MTQPKHQSYFELDRDHSLEKLENITESQEEESERDDLIFSSNSIFRPNKKRSSPLAFSLIATLLVVIVILQTILLSGPYSATKNSNSPTGLSKEYSVERTLYLPNKYASPNQTEANLAWTAILPGHGFIAASPEWAKQHNLPDTMKNPGHNDQLLYIVQSYHELHCVKIIRAHYLALYEGRQWDWDFQHDMHCFDSLRQYIMCNPDDTLLQTTGHRDAGHGQVKKCQDWDALRQWTEERTGSYFDGFDYVSNSTMKGLFNNYHEGDGLPVGSFY